MSDVERAAFAALTRQLSDDPLEAEPAPQPVPPTWTDKEAVAALVEVYRRRQRTQLEEFARRYGEGPTLRRDRTQLADGGLLGIYSCDSLEERARRDQQARTEQERLRLVYLARREREARRRKHEARLAARLAHGRNAVYEIVDRDRLHICTRCDEIVYPPNPSAAGRSSTSRRRIRHGVTSAAAPSSSPGIPPTSRSSSTARARASSVAT